VKKMTAVLEFLLILSTVIGLGVKIWVIAWKLKLAIRRAIRRITENKMIAFFTKVAMFLYFFLVVATIDRTISN
jgi:hypothetical protein